MYKGQTSGVVLLDFACKNSECPGILWASVRSAALVAVVCRGLTEKGENMFEISVKTLLEAGVHFGHQTRRWNPKMAPYIFGEKDRIHIVNLDRTVAMMKVALQAVHDVAADGGRILFVGTKRQSCDRVAEAAKKCGQYFVNHRWLGGMLTNWKTVSQSIKKLENLENRLKDENVKLKKKEILTLQRKTEKLNRALGGVRNMGGIPSMLFVLDAIVERTAIEEAHVLGIPVVAVCDTNADPSIVDYPIPGNDDSTRAIDLYCTLAENAVLEGIQAGLTESGVDIGSLENPVQQPTKIETADEASEALSEEGSSENAASE